MKSKNALKKAIVIALIIIAPMISIAQNVGQSAPNFTVNTLGGSSFSLFDHQGKVVFLYLFGYACPFCLGTGNSTETEIYQVFGENANFVAVGVDTWDGNDEGVQSFKSSTGITYPLGLDGSFLEDLYSTSYDRIIVIDQEGIIRYKATGRVNLSIVNESKVVIEEYLDMITDIEDEIVQPTFSLYPIPAQNELRIKSNSQISEINSFRIYGMQGKLLVQKDDFSEIKQGEISIPLDDLKNGAYFLHIESVGYKYVNKFIVAR